MSGRPRLLYLAFAITLLPLVFQTFAAETDLEDRILQTISSHPEINEKLETAESPEEVFSLLPGGRVEGAHLARSSRVHWIYAVVAAAAFFAVTWLLFDPGRASIAHWFLIAGAAGTIGIISLLAFQWIAEWSQVFWLTGRSILVFLFLIVKFIGFSYRAALDADTGFLLSFLGFTCGVGLCEEVTKVLPVVTWLGSNKKPGWRAACMLGLASGVGFGIAEAIMYSGQFYNGLMTYDIYFTRFISCVALHATWSAAIGIIAAQNLAGFDADDAFTWCLHLLRIIAIPAVLHGLYDTLLKRDLGGYALLTAVASFAWLVFVIERTRSGDTESMPRRMGVPLARAA